MAGRIVRFDGRIATEAHIALAALVAVCFFGGFIARASGGEEPARAQVPVLEQQLVGEVPAGAAATTLSAVAALPALRRPQPARRPARRRAATRTATAPVTAAATPAPEAAATPTPAPVAQAPVSTPAPAAPAPPPAAPPRATPAPSGDSFDSSG